jgi:hypothetical protein
VAIAIQSENLAGNGNYFTASMLVGSDFLTNRDGFEVTIAG